MLNIVRFSISKYIQTIKIWATGSKTQINDYFNKLFIENDKKNFQPLDRQEFLPGNDERGRKGGEEKTEPARMAKDFDFQMSVIYIMSKSTMSKCTVTKSG